MIWKYLSILFIIGLVGIVSATGIAFNHTVSSSSITWTWTGNDLGISNLSIDGMEVCGIPPDLTSFFLQGLDPNSTHTIDIKYEGDDYIDSATTTIGSGGSYSSSFSNGENVRVNQSSIQDPSAGKAEPWILWVISGCAGLILIVVALLKPKTYHMDYEINIIISVIAWPFLWYWTWGGLTSIDYITGTGMAGVNGESVMITQHIYYTFPVLGWIGVGASAAAVFITILLIGQFKLFKEIEDEQTQRQRSENQ
jgi:hypothetical protein